MVEEKTLTDLPHKILETAAKAGIEASGEGRSGSLFHLNQETVYSAINREFEGRVEVMDTKEALRKYGWLSDYLWRAVKADADEYTRKVAEEYSGGYFMRVFEGAEVDFPLQSCLMIARKGLEQRIHNIIIAEPGSKARIISGCIVEEDIGGGSHLGISEFYVKESATLNFTMIHNWDENMTVRPRSAAIVEAGGSFISNYICLRPVRDLQMYPKATCLGRGSRARFNSIIYGVGGSAINVGSMIDLQGEGSSGEITSRVIAKDKASVTAPGRLLGNNAGVKAHMECRGLLLDDGASIHAIPELYSNRKDVEMSHEAAVGRIADKEINYLMSRGLPRDEATSLIVRGFLDVDILGLPPKLKAEVDGIVDSLVEGM